MNLALETKVGIFVVAATLLIAVISISFGKVDFGKSSGYVVEFQIRDASGLSVKTPVYYKGVKVGAVKSINLNGSDLFVKLRLFEEFEIPDNVLFTVKQSGFVGEKYVELVQNLNEPATAILQAGKVYKDRQSASGLDVVIDRVDKMANEITIFVASLNRVFDQDNTTIALNETIQNLKTISANIDKIVSSNDNKINDIFTHIDNLSASLDKLLTRNESNINDSLDNINELTKSLKQFSASLDNISQLNESNINDSLSNIKEITDKLNIVMNDIQTISKDINEGKGTVGMLINDNETKDEVKNVVSSVKTMLTKFDDFKLDIAFGVDYLFDANDARGYAEVRLFTKPYKYFLLGISNAPRTKTTKKTTHFVVTPVSGTLTPQDYYVTEDVSQTSTLAFSLQYGYIFYDLVGLRVGIFENALGVGADFYMPYTNKDLSLSLEIYDFHSFSSGFEAYTRAYVKWNFLNYFFVQAGMEDLLNNNKRVFTIGGGVRFADDDLKFLAGSAASAASAIK